MTVAMPGLPPPHPIPIKDRSSILFLEKGRLDVLDGAFVLVDEAGVRLHIPVGGIVCLMLEPGTRVSHAAVALAARAGTLLIWVGEAGVRLYAAGQPGGARADRLLYQARLALDDEARLRIVRKMYAMRFNEEAPSRRSVDQLRGIEGARVREMYKALAARHGVAWTRRNREANCRARLPGGVPGPPRAHERGSLDTAAAGHFCASEGKIARCEAAGA
jgi:CRISP-associated protein Cas1